jgi:hypothetical protein
MWKDEDLILNYSNFWSQKQLFADYIVPAAPETSIAQYQKGLECCIDRIEGCRTRTRAEAIIKTISVSITITDCFTSDSKYFFNSKIVKGGNFSWWHFIDSMNYYMPGHN